MLADHIQDADVLLSIKGYRELVKADEETKRKQKEQGMRSESTDTPAGCRTPKRVSSNTEGKKVDSYGQIKDRHGQTQEDKIADKAA